MIVDGMTYGEITKEYSKIWAEARQTTLNHFDRRPFERYFRKNKTATNVYFEERKVKIDNTTNLYIIPVAPNKAFFEKFGVRYTSFLTFHTGRGLEIACRGCSRINGEPEYTFYTLHFFERYRERYLEDPSLTLLKTIRHFIKHNNQESRYIYHGEYKDFEHHFIGTCEAGMTLGVFVDDQIALYKTFLSREYLSRNKAEKMEKLDVLYKEREEKFGGMKQMLMSDAQLLQSLCNDSFVTTVLMQ